MIHEKPRAFIDFDFIKKVVILVLIVWASIIIYKKILGPVLGPFFKEHKEKTRVFF